MKLGIDVKESMIVIMNSSANGLAGVACFQAQPWEHMLNKLIF